MQRYLPSLSFALLLLSAAAVLVAGMAVARREKVLRIAPDRAALERFADAARTTLQQLDFDYDRRLTELAGRLDFQDERAVQAACNEVVGIVRVSRLLPGAPDLHLGVDYLRETNRIPLFTLVRSESSLIDQVLLPAGKADHGWVESASLPLAFWHRREKGEIVVFTLFDRALQAAFHPVLRNQLPDYRRSLTGPPGHHRWMGPDGIALSDRPLAESIATLPPDAVLPLRSRFGTWLIECWDERQVERLYHPAGLISTALAAGMLVLLGGGLFVFQRRAAMHATQRVSFVNRVSHELRTPLTNMLLNLDLAEDELPHDDSTVAREHLALVRQESARLARLIDNVLTFSCAERNQLSAHLEPHLLAPLLEPSIKTFQPILQRRGIDLQVRIPAELSAYVDADAFVQIVTNLLSNIEKYAPGGPARLEVDADSNNVRLRFQDSGPGVPAGMRERIFSPFVRASDEPTEGVSGAGLGLSIARDLARRMNGDLALMPSEKGALFELRLPTP
jgi:signal transduction histidine kinase